MEGKLSEDHVSHIIRTGLHACVVTILTRSCVSPAIGDASCYSKTHPINVFDDSRTLALEHRPRSNDFLLKAVEFSLRFLGHEASTYLCQILFRVFLHNFKYASFYEKPSREDIPEELKKKFLPETVCCGATPNSFCLCVPISNPHLTFTVFLGRGESQGMGQTT
jgi:hypothetical protein